ncbi:hypothetical protein VTI28DRAFT_7186 [Corynascus sepedonium]
MLQVRKALHLPLQTVVGQKISAPLLPSRHPADPQSPDTSPQSMTTPVLAHSLTGISTGLGNFRSDLSDFVFELKFNSSQQNFQPLTWRLAWLDCLALNCLKMTRLPLGT